MPQDDPKMYDLDAIREQVTDFRQHRAELSGRRKELMGRLKGEHGFDNTAAAKTALAEMKTDINANQEALDAALAKIGGADGTGE